MSISRNCCSSRRDWHSKHSPRQPGWANESVWSITMSPVLGLASIYSLRNYIRGVPTNSDTSSFRHESPIHKHVSKNKSYLPELNSTRLGRNCLLKKARHVRKANKSKQALEPSACRSPRSVGSRWGWKCLRSNNEDGRALSLQSPAKVTRVLLSKQNIQNILGASRFAEIVSILQLLERTDRASAK